MVRGPRRFAGGNFRNETGSAMAIGLWSAATGVMVAAVRRARAGCSSMPFLELGSFLIKFCAGGDGAPSFFAARVAESRESRGGGDWISWTVIGHWPRRPSPSASRRAGPPEQLARSRSGLPILVGLLAWPLLFVDPQRSADDSMGRCSA